MAAGAHEGAALEYSPLSSITDAASPISNQRGGRRQPSWAEGLSPVSTDNNHSWAPDGAEEPEDDETLLRATEQITLHDALLSVACKTVPAKLLTRDKEHLLQIQLCWACRLEVAHQTDNTNRYSPLDDFLNPPLKVPHFAVSSWEDIANIIHSDNGIEATEMIFWLRQQMFQSGHNHHRIGSESTTSSFDALCSSSAEDYAKATDIQGNQMFPVEEACLRCKRTSLLPVIFDASQDSKHAVQSAILFKESALKARAIGAQAKKFATPTNKQQPLSAPSTPFTASAAMKRHLTESPPDGNRRQVVNLFNAIGLNEQNWRPRPHFQRPYRVPAYNRWSPANSTGGLNTGSTDYSTNMNGGGGGASSPQRRRPLRKQGGGRRKMSTDRGGLLL